MSNDNVLFWQTKCKPQNHNLKNLVVIEFAKGKNISLSEGACWQLLDLQPNLHIFFPAWIWITEAGVHSAIGIAFVSFFLSPAGL
jgi:hypothetical protein